MEKLGLASHLDKNFPETRHEEISHRAKGGDNARCYREKKLKNIRMKPFGYIKFDAS
jgi:hypothetical protein